MVAWLDKLQIRLKDLFALIRAQAGWLENLAKLAHDKFYFFAPLFLLSVFAIVGSNQWLHWIERTIPARLVRGVAGSIGEAAFFLGFVATLYYGMRDVFATARKLHAPIPAWLDSPVKYWIMVLRLMHPLLGVAVFSVVLLHGYVMWRILAAGKFSFAIETGLSAAAILVLVAFSGLFIRWMPKLTKLRYVHRLVGILFTLAFVVHKIVAD